MNTDVSDQASRPHISSHVASCVIRVCDLDRSVEFYCDVFSCTVALRDTDMALLLAPNGFQLYMHARSSFHHRGMNTLGCQYLMWATEAESDLTLIAERLRGYDSAAYTHTEGGVTFLEGCDPDGGRIIVAHPSPRQLPRTLIAERLRG